MTSPNTMTHAATQVQNVNLMNLQRDIICYALDKIGNKIERATLARVFEEHVISDTLPDNIRSELSVFRDTVGTVLKNIQYTEINEFGAIMNALHDLSESAPLTQFTFLADLLDRGEDVVLEYSNSQRKAIAEFMKHNDLAVHFEVAYRFATLNEYDIRIIKSVRGALLNLLNFSVPQGTNDSRRIIAILNTYMSYALSDASSLLEYGADQLVDITNMIHKDLDLYGINEHCMHKEHVEALQWLKTYQAMLYSDFTKEDCKRVYKILTDEYENPVNSANYDGIVYGQYGIDLIEKMNGAGILTCHLPVYSDEELVRRRVVTLEG